MPDPPDPQPTFRDAYLPDMRPLLQHHLGRVPDTVRPIPSHTDTIVVEASVDDVAVILKACDPDGLDPSRIVLEAWACEQARGVGVPAPAVLAVDASCSLFPAPYFVMEKVSGQPLETHAFTMEERRVYLQQMGVLLRKVHAVKVAGYGWLDELHYRATEEVRGEHGSWQGAIEREVRRALDYLLDLHLINVADASVIDRVLEYSAPRLQRWQRSALLHGDIGPNVLFVDGTTVTGIIDWGNRWAGDPMWDLVMLDWEGGRPFQWVLEGYEPDVPLDEIVEERLPLYTVFQAVSWAAWCHKRSFRRPLRVIPSVLRIARNHLSGESRVDTTDCEGRYPKQ